MTALKTALKDPALGSAVLSVLDEEDDLEPLVPVLIDRLKTGALHPEAERYLLMLLDRIPGKLAEAVPAVLERARIDGRHHLLGSLGESAADDTAIFNALLAGLGDERTRLPAVKALGYAGEAAKSALPELKRLGRGASPELAECLGLGGRSDSNAC